MEKLEDIIFYSLEKAIKSYRQLAQRNINLSGQDITIDQWLIMKSILENSHMTQAEIAEKVFKDAASVTRIIDLLIEKKYLKRDAHEDDRRRTQLMITKTGKDILKRVQSIINKNRALALEGLNQNKIKDLRNTLSIIISNCQG